MEAETSGEQPVTVGDVDHVGGDASDRCQRAGVDLGEHLHVRRRVADHGRLARRPRGGVDPDDVGEGHRQHPVGVGLAKLVFPGEGQPLEIGERANRAHPFQLPSPVGRVDRTQALDQPRQALALERPHLVGR